MNDNSILASIITIGDELLIGQTIDTNSAWMATELNKVGIHVKRRVAVGDVWNDIWQTLEEEGRQAPIVLITGGLGPTSDDITKPLLCQFFEGELIVDNQALENVRNIFEKLLNRPLLERNLKQAEVPNTCQVIQNKRGTAPGMWFEKNGTIYISMPGVPHEMKGMMIDYVIPAFKRQFKLVPIQHRTLLTAGIGESFLADLLITFEENLPTSIKLAYLPNYGMVRLRLSCQNPQVTVEKLNDLFYKLKEIVKEYLVIDEDLSLQETIARILIQQKKTLAIAESCTGGYISHLITAIPGSSVFFKGGIISYANEAKTDTLDVPEEIIAQFGAVSLETVEKMAEGIRLKMKTDFALATSGIMGPGGGTDTKPVGFVCIAFSSESKTVSTTLQFRFDRQRNIELTAAHSLNFLRKNVG